LARQPTLNLFGQAKVLPLGFDEDESGRNARAVPRLWPLQDGKYGLKDAPLPTA
jgi:hypothetical protein